MSKVTWLHISDWHQKGEDFDRQVVRDLLMKDISERAAIDPDLARIDFIIFSGDLAYHGKAQEYDFAIRYFFTPLLEAVGLGDSGRERLFIVPGNHDVDRSAFDLLPDNLIEKLSTPEAVATWLNDKRKRRALFEPMADYSDFISRYLGGYQDFKNYDLDYCSIKRLEVEGNSLAILCLNSTWLSGHNKDSKGEVNDRGYLILGEPQIHTALAQTNDADVRIAVMHHPFEWLNEFDRNRVEERLTTACHFILCGHQHIPQIKVTQGPGGDYIYIPAGASYDRRTPHDPRYANSYNFVSLNFDTGRGTIFFRRWSDRRTEWVADTDVTGDGRYLFNLPKRLKPAGGGLKTVKVAVAMAQGTSYLKEVLAEAVQEVNQKAAEENRGARIGVVSWREEGAYRGFHPNSPRSLMERITDDDDPDIIVALFHGRFAAESQGDTGSPTQEYDRFAQMLRQADSPHILLYFLDKDFNPRNPEEQTQKDYFRDFLTYFLPDINKLWWYFKRPAALRKLVFEQLWEFIRLRTQSNSSAWTDKPSVDIGVPEGWQQIEEVFLDKERGKLEDDNRLSPEDAASFFDGESPKWKHIVSKSIRPREQVAELVKELAENIRKGRTRVTLLIGPGGEGKSTILRQVAVSLVESHPHINVIWRDLKATAPAALEKSWLQPLLKQGQPFLIIIDQADQIIEDIWESVVFLSEQNSTIQFLLASRTIDWEWARAESKPWRRILGGSQSSPNYLRKQISALTEEDARRVVGAWEEAGTKGLGDFVKEEAGGRAAKLFRLAKEEGLKNPEEGSFLGAMIEARKADTFRDYVGDILRRLDGRAISGGKTLQDAFAYIVASHADNLRILTRPVLRHVLGCSMEELDREVIRPLADEADVSSSVLVLARHIAIARVARQILAEEFRVQFETQVLPALARAAIRKFKAKDGEMRREDVSPWNKLPRHYADKLKQVKVALGLAEALAEAEPEDPLPIITWANIYRHDGQIKEAVNVFRRHYDDISPDKLNKGFFTEWAAAESRAKNYCHDAWLGGIALSDLIADLHPGDDTPMIILSSLTSSFISLYRKADDPSNTAFHSLLNAQVFLKATAAAAQLGLDDRAQKGLRPDYNKGVSIKYLDRGRELGVAKRITTEAPAEAVDRVVKGITLAWELRDKDDDWDGVPPSLPSAHQLTFRRLRAIFE